MTNQAQKDIKIKLKELGSTAQQLIKDLFTPPESEATSKEEIETIHKDIKLKLELNKIEIKELSEKLKTMKMNPHNSAFFSFTPTQGNRSLTRRARREKRQAKPTNR